MRLSRRLLHGIAALLVCTGLMGAVASPAHAVKQVKRSKPALTQAAFAKQLVRDVRIARTDRARATAMRRMFGALGIGVTSRAGAPIVTSGLPNDAGHFHLLDVQVNALARQLKRGQLRGSAEVAALLTQGGSSWSEVEPFPADVVSLSVRSAVRDSLKHPRSRQALLPLVVRELGTTRPQKAQRQDLAKVPHARHKYDALQSFLISADIQLTALAWQDSRRGSSRPVKRAKLSAECKKYNDAVDKLQKAHEKAAGGKIQAWIEKTAIGRIGSELKGHYTNKAMEWATAEANVRVPAWAKKALGAGAKYADLAATIKEGLHGAALAYSIDVTALSSSEKTHHGHDGPGEPITFRTKVESLDNYGEKAATCGKAAGVHLPEKGPIEGVSVLWLDSETKQLQPTNGVLSCPDARICITKTDKRGIAELTFEPKIETSFIFRNSPSAMEREDVGQIRSLALYQSAFDPGKLGLVSQILFPKMDGTRWHVRFHQSPGVRIRGTVSYAGANEQSTAVLDMQICHADPLNAPASAYSGTVRFSGQMVGLGDPELERPWDHTAAVSVSLDQSLHPLPVPLGARSFVFVTPVPGHPSAFGSYQGFLSADRNNPQGTLRRIWSGATWDDATSTALTVTEAEGCP
ncbi:MAG: hypothetical protein ABI200_04265 [Gaiellales bacterium]